MGFWCRLRTSTYIVTFGYILCQIMIKPWRKCENRSSPFNSATYSFSKTISRWILACNWTCLFSKVVAFIVQKQQPALSWTLHSEIYSISSQKSKKIKINYCNEIRKYIWREKHIGSIVHVPEKNMLSLHCVCWVADINESHQSV